MHRRLALLTLALTTGCGSVTFDELDPFGRIASATWLVLDGPDVEQHLLVASNVGNLCGRLDEEAVEFTDAWEDWRAAVDEAKGDDDRVASATERFLSRTVEATRRLAAPGASYLVLDPKGDDPPDAGEARVGPGKSVTGRYHHFEENPYRKAQREADPSDVEEVLDRLGRAQDTWILAGGTAIFDPRGDDGWRVELDGVLEEDDGDDAGTVKLRHTFRRCEITVPEAFRLPF